MVAKQLPQATFRISDNELWENFKAKAKAKGTNASAVFWQFARDYVDGVDVSVGSVDRVNLDSVDSRIDEKLLALEQSLSELTRQDRQIADLIDAFSDTVKRNEFDELKTLEQKSSEQISLLTDNLANAVSQIDGLDEKLEAFATSLREVLPSRNEIDGLKEAIARLEAAEPVKKPLSLVRKAA